MNWKDVPHLFANGKFSLRRPHPFLDSYQTIELNLGTSINTRWVTYPSKLNDCTLIARKIEDMTDEEWLKMPTVEKSDNIETIKDIYIKNSQEGDYIPYIDFLHLLSIGVYPFDQSHFEDGTVIDVNLSKPTQHTEK